MFIFASASNVRQIPPQAGWQGVVWMAGRSHRASSLLEVPEMSVHSGAVGRRGEAVAHGCISGLCFALCTQPSLSSGAVYLVAHQ